MKSTTAPPVAATLNTLVDSELDRKIRDRAKMISVALADCDRALEMVKMCERSAVLSAWRLGQFLIEKKEAPGARRVGRLAVCAVPRIAYFRDELHAARP